MNIRLAGISDRAVWQGSDHPEQESSQLGQASAVSSQAEAQVPNGLPKRSNGQLVRPATLSIPQTSTQDQNFAGIHRHDEQISPNTMPEQPANSPMASSPLSATRKNPAPRPPPPDALKPPARPILLQIGGIKHSAIKEAQINAASLHTTLVCVLWVPSGQIFYWNGHGTSTLQRVKGLEVCNAMKDIEHSSRASIVRIEEGHEDDTFWNALGGRQRVPGAVAQDAAGMELEAMSGTMFLEFGDGQELVVDTANGPLRRGMLKQNKACLIIAPGRRAYVWMGRCSAKVDMDAALRRGEQFASRRDVPQWIPKTVEKVVDGWEGTLFRSLFSDWMTACGTTAKLRNEGDSPLAVDRNVIARQTNAVLANTASGEALYQVKGKKLVTCRQVPLHVSCLGQSGVYVLSTKGMIYQWNGPQATPQEKTKAADFCLSLRDHEHGGRAAIKVLDGDGRDTKDGAVFWGKLKTDASEAVPSNDNDVDFEERARQGICLLKVRSADDAQGEPMPRPFRHPMLEADGAFILFWQGEQLFVWTGNAASQEIKVAAFALASSIQKQWESTGARRTVGIQAAPQHGEPALFKAHFQGWQQGPPGVKRDVANDREGRTQTPSPTHLRQGQVFKDKSTLLLEERAALVDLDQLEAAGPAQAELITPAVKNDDGSTGSVRVWRVVNGRLSELQATGPEGDNPSLPLVLASSSCYVLCYKFCPGVDRTQVRHVLYAWQGCRGTKQDIASATLCLNEVSAMVKGQGMQDRQVIFDGKETPHFLIACGRVMVVSHNRHEERDGSARAQARLFEARYLASTAGVPTGKAVEVVCSSASLYSGACLILLLPSANQLAAGGKVAAWVWRGGFSVLQDFDVAKAGAARLLGNPKNLDACVQVVDEGREPAEFWGALGGGRQYRKIDSGSRDRVRVTRLFHLEMAGDMARPREISLPVKDDLGESPSGACLVDYQDSLKPSQAAAGQ
jgi:hypothetical protein